jgi:hypothetical protein
MALTRQLQEDELALLEIIEDPIWLGEFLRSTRDGSPNKEEWPKTPFEYRWYQRDLLTDYSEFIILTAGRAVGKCQPRSARVYTPDQGYTNIADLLKLQRGQGYVNVYAIDPKTKELVQKRARLSGNGVKDIYKVTTESGFELEVTDNHPILTQRGYIMVQDLEDDDDVAVVTKLPEIIGKETYTWEELRWLGYFLGRGKKGVETVIPIKFQRQLDEFKRISQYFGTNLRVYGDHIILRRKLGPLPHYGTRLLKESGLNYLLHNRFLTRLPKSIKALSNNQLKIFIEAYFSAKATFSPTNVTFDQLSANVAKDIQEVLLRFGVETKLTPVYIDENEQYLSIYNISLLDENAYYLFFTTFDIPGISVKNLHPPLEPPRALPFLRFECIRSIERTRSTQTFALEVNDVENYISENVFVHNSLVMEDKLIYEAVNSHIVFPETKEQVLVTPNVAQMTPILDRIVMRFMGSRFLKGWVNQFNKSKGTFDYKSGSGNYRMHARIAGSRGEANMVGLHIGRIKGDETQLFPMQAYVQLRPAFNQWEANTQQFWCGVPSGGRDGNVLYFMDQRSKVFKKYRIPATENPYWRQSDHIGSY